MAKRARILLLTDDEPNHRHARHLVDSRVLPIRNPWLLGPGDLGSLTVSPDLVVALGESAVLPAARLRERLGLPGPRPADVLPLLDKELMHRKARAAGLPTTRQLSAHGVRNWHFRTPLAVKARGEVRKITSATELPLVGAFVYEEWIDADVCHVDGVAVGGRVLFATASRYLGTRHDFATGTGMGGITLDAAEARALLATAEVAVNRLSVPDGAFHVELFDSPTGPILLTAAPHPPSALLQAMTRAATGVDLLAEHIRAGVGQPTFPQRTLDEVAGYWRVPRRKTPRTPTLPTLHGEVVRATLPEPGRPAPAEVVVQGHHAAVVLTDLIALREHLDETVHTP